MRPTGGLIQSSTPTLASSFSVQAHKATSEYDIYVETVTTASRRIRVSRSSVSISSHPRQENSDRIFQSRTVTGWPAD